MEVNGELHPGPVRVPEPHRGEIRVNAGTIPVVHREPAKWHSAKYQPGERKPLLKLPESQGRRNHNPQRRQNQEGTTNISAKDQGKVTRASYRRGQKTQGSRSLGQRNGSDLHWGNPKKRQHDLRITITKQLVELEEAEKPWDYQGRTGKQEQGNRWTSKDQGFKPKTHPSTLETSPRSWAENK